MAELTYRKAVTRALEQEMTRDPRVVLLGEDVESGGVFKTTEGLIDKFGRTRVRNTPISEEAILGAAMGAAMTGMRPVAEIMFSDFLAVCWNLVVNEIAKMRYMTAGQVTLPLVIRAANGGGTGLGAQHSQAVENWAMAVPGLKVVTASNPRDVVGLLSGAIRCDDPVLFLEQKALYAGKAELEDGEITRPLGEATVLRQGGDCTIVSLGAMVPVAFQAAQSLAQAGVKVTVIDLCSLVPLDIETVKRSVRETGRLLIVEENPRPGGWGGELTSIITEECFGDLRGATRRIAAPYSPLPAAPVLEKLLLPSVERIQSEVLELVGA